MLEGARVCVEGAWSMLDYAWSVRGVCSTMPDYTWSMPGVCVECAAGMGV